MDIRALPVGQGLAWFKQAIDLGARNPRAVFGGALLLIGALYVVALVFAMLGALAGGGVAATAGDAPPDLGRVLLAVMPLFLLVMLLVPVLLGGLMHVIREAEAGRPVRARDVFLPLRSPDGLRLALLGLVQLALALVGGLLMVLLAGGDYWRDYLAALQGAMRGSLPAMPQPDNPGLLFLVQLVFNYFSYVLMLLSIPLMLFSGQRLGGALHAALRAAVRNVAAYLLAGVLFVGALLLGMLVVLLVGALLALLGNLVHAAVGSLLTALVMLGFAAVVLVLIVGGAYLAWRDTFGDAAVPPPAPVARGIEV